MQSHTKKYNKKKLLAPKCWVLLSVACYSCMLVVCDLEISSTRKLLLACLFIYLLWRDYNGLEKIILSKMVTWVMVKCHKTSKHLFNCSKVKTASFSIAFGK